MFEPMRQLVVFADKPIDFSLDEFVLVLKHANVVLEGLLLRQQIEVFVVASIVEFPLLFNFQLKLVNDSLFFVD